MSAATIADSAAAITRAVVERFNWDREEQMVEAYHELLPVVRAGLSRFDRLRRRQARRLDPLGNPEEEVGDAAE